MNMEYSPIILFVYNRPELAGITLEALAANKEAASSLLYIFSDGPKQGATDQQLTRIAEVRKLIREKQWCKEVNIIESKTNKGLAQSVIEGVTSVVNEHQRAIVLEDDVVLSRHFLSYMNNSLIKYENEPKVGSIAAWNYFCPPGKVRDNFFFRLPDSISWGIFKRSWSLLEQDVDVLIEEIHSRKLEEKLNIGNAVDLVHSLQLQKEKKTDSWAVRWTATCVLNDLLTFYPRISLTKHIGYGVTSTNCKDDYDEFNYKMKVAADTVLISDIPIKENPDAVQCYQRFYQRKKNRLFRYYNKLRQRYDL